MSTTFIFGPVERITQRRVQMIRKVDMSCANVDSFLEVDEIAGLGITGEEMQLDHGLHRDTLLFLGHPLFQELAFGYKKS